MIHDPEICRPLRVAVANDYELIVAGVARMLEQYPDRVEVCERFLAGEQIDADGDIVDIALYDVFGRDGTPVNALEELLASPHVRCVAVFSSDLRPELVAKMQHAGVQAFISKALTAVEIVAALEQAATGRPVFADTSGPLDLSCTALGWPGQEHGLSERESEVLVLLGEGLTNTEIARSLFLSLETVKSHVSTLLTKLGARNRVQAATYVARTGAHRATELRPGG